MRSWSAIVENPESTERLAKVLADALFPGAVVALVGPLGAGKTRLVQAIAEALGANRALVASPTFVLIHEYAARLPIYHFDAYRLGRPAEFAELGIEEYFTGSGVCLIEWADRVRAYLPEEYLEVSLSITGPTSRRVDFIAHGPGYEKLIGQISSC